MAHQWRVAKLRLSRRSAIGTHSFRRRSVARFGRGTLFAQFSSGNW